VGVMPVPTTPTALEQFFQYLTRNNGVDLPKRPIINFLGGATDDPDNNQILIPGASGWVAGGPLIWSPVDLVDSMVTSGVGAQSIHVTGVNGNNWGTAFFVTYAGRKCSGVRFRWGSGSPALTVQCALWDNAHLNPGNRTANAGTGTIAVHAEGVYSYLFPVPIVLLPGLFYVVSAKDTAGTHDMRLISGNTVTASFLNSIQKFFGFSEGGRTIAPGVMITPGVADASNGTLCAQIGGGGGDPTTHQIPSQSTADPMPIEPIIV